MHQKKYVELLERFLPSDAVHYCYDLWINYPFHLKITRSRQSKLGDYRYSPNQKSHTITINQNLNPYNFLITYIHEVAHLVTHVQYNGRILPHGKEWKKTFQELMMPMLSNLVFPDDILRPLMKYMKNPAASSCSDPGLFKALRQYDEETSLVMLSELLSGEQFIFHHRFFTKEKIRRTKVLCTEVHSGKKYLIPQLAMVLKVEDAGAILEKSCG